MTIDELDQATRSLIADIATRAPGTRHRDLGRLHRLMAAYARSGRASPSSMRQLLEELTNEAVEAQFENMPV